MRRSWISNLRRKSTAFAPIAPDHPFYVIGDIHGRADLLARALDQLPPGVPIICVGDYIDRGENSAQVLQMLQGRSDIQCLKGNHEEMLLRFLDDPQSQGPHWLRHGGLQTLASYGITGVTETSEDAALIWSQEALATAMGAQLISWIRTLKLFYSCGNVAVTHAGAAPNVALEDQQQRHLLWGHPNFVGSPRKDGTWIVHGHTIVNAPTARQGRISIDTGAYATGKLTVASLHAGGVEFLEF